jgi:hypothetical protein
VANGGGIGQRRTAELVHVWRAAGSGHGEVYDGQALRR